MDQIDAMRTFVAVVSEGSFTRAAERLQTSPQLVSKYVSQLEERLGLRLLNRTTRQVHLTEAGAHYLQHAEQILEAMDDMESQLGDLKEGAQGKLRISAPVSFANLHMPSAICEFQQRFPKVSIDLQLSDRKVNVVEEGYDIALRIGYLKSSSLIAKPLATINMVVCASPEYLAARSMPKTLEDLRPHRILGYSNLDPDTAMTRLYESLISHSDKSHGFLHCNNGEVLVNAAIAGAGIAIQPTFIAGPAIAAKKLQVINLDFVLEPAKLYAVYAHRKLLASKVRCFIEFMDGYFGESPCWDAFDS